MGMSYLSPQKALLPLATSLNIYGPRHTPEHFSVNSLACFMFLSHLLHKRALDKAYSCCLPSSLLLLNFFKTDLIACPWSQAVSGLRPQTSESAAQQASTRDIWGLRGETMNEASQVQASKHPALLDQLLFISSLQEDIAPATLAHSPRRNQG
jgi:hypothetical protein